MQSTPLRRQRGITLIESLVALFVTALGILGILGIQMRTLADTQTSVRRAQAIQLIEDLGERMRVNPNALMNLTSYVSAFGSFPAVGSCATGCSPSQLAAFDVASWKQTVRNTLPLGDASIFLATGETNAANRRQLGIMISWRENERAGLTADDREQTDATRVRDADGDLVAGATTTCPTDRICHLQYIPVAARCAPYTSGGGGTQYFCAGS